MRRSLRITLATLAPLLLFLLLALLALRLLLPQWDGLAAVVEQRVGTMIDREVQLGSLHFGWSGWAPELVANEVRISQPDAGPLAARELGVSLAPLRSLRARSPVLGHARLTGIHLDVQRDTEGVWDVHGWRFGGAGSLALDWRRHFAGMERLQIEEATLHWADGMTGIETGLRVDSLGLRSDRSGLALVGRGRFLPEAGGPVYVGITVPPAGPDRIEFFLDAQGVQLPYWSQLGGWLQGGLHGTASVRLWATLENGRVRQLQGEHDSRLLVVRDGRWREQPVGHRFQWLRDGTTAVSHWAETTPGAGNARLEYRMPNAGEGVDRVVLAAAGIDIDHYVPTGTALRFRDVPDLARLARIDPSGRLETLHMVLERDPEGWQVQAADAQLRDMQLHAAGVIPGVNGLDASLEWADGQGVLTLDSNALRVAMPTLFSEEFLFDRLHTRLLLRRDEAAWHLEAHDLFLENQDAALEGRGSIEFGAAPHLDLALRFLRADGRQVARYLPVHRFPARTYRWLVESIRTATVTDGGMVFRGHPKDFPFADNEGVFDLWAVVEDGVLDYQPDWPLAEGLSGTLHFHNSGFRAEQVSGKILDSAVSQTTVVIGNMLREPELEIRGQARGPVQDLATYLRQSGIGRDFLPYLAGVQPRGSSVLDLDLLIPLHGPGPAGTRAAGRLGLDRAALELPERRLALEDITGDIRFDPQRGVRGQEIRAEIHGEPVLLNLQRAATGPAMRIHAQGRQALAPWVGERAAARLAAQGTAHWDAEIVVDAAGDSRLELASNLEGMQMDWPAPFAKTRGTRRPLQISWPLQREGEAIARVRFDQVLEADIRVAPGRAGGAGEVRALALNLGRPPPGMPALPERGIDLRARLDSVDVDAWLRSVRELTADTVPIEAAAGLELVRADLEAVDSLRWGGRVLPGGRLRVERGADGQRLVLDSEWVQGEAVLTDPAAGDPRAGARGHWQVDLAHLHLDQWETPVARSGRSRPVAQDAFADPRTWPGLDLRIGDLRLGNLHLADVAFALLPSTDGLELRDLRLRAPQGDVSLLGDGHWEMSPDGLAQTRIRAEATGTDWGSALNSMGVSPAMQSASGSARASLAWAGPLFVPDITGLSGTVDIDLADGRLHEVEPGAGRLLGLVSLDVIPRRLRLDFRDVYTQGLAFDQMVGEAVIEGGDLLLPELRIASPSAVVRVSGRTGLVARDFDQSIVVVPRLRSTLPIVGALLGGPVTGAVVLLVERVLGIGDQMEEAARVEYFVTGPWSDPEIRARVKMEQGTPE
ncbi:MAG: TIGR02099 family protein [Thioalkalivibrio sp.]|nr:MAG: TIGR02099 family protein [Thioalkalivibrio sp.]